MTLPQIKAAIAAGKRVYWSNTGYEVIKDRIGQYLIHCTMNHHYIGLVHADGVTMNGDESDFFTA